jgi:hypothetical protein
MSILQDREDEPQRRRDAEKKTIFQTAKAAQHAKKMRICFSLRLCVSAFQF